MAEYISDLGYTYTDEEINKAAEEQGKTVAEIMQKHNLKPASADKSMEESADMEIDGPGKKKRVVPTPTATQKNTVFSSGKSSLGSQKTPFSNVEVTTQKQKEETPEWLKGGLKPANKNTSGRIADAYKVASQLNSKSRMGTPSEFVEQKIAKEEVQKGMNAYAKEKEKIDAIKVDEYASKLGDDVWLDIPEIEDISSYGAKVINNTLNPNSGGIVPFKTENETSLNLLGIADNTSSRKFDYESLPDGKFVVNSLPAMQAKWTINNGRITKEADVINGIDPTLKALNNGKLFLSSDEVALQKNTDLLVKAKKEKNSKEIARLESEIKQGRNQLGLGNRLYDETTGNLLTISEANAKKKQVEKKASELAKASSYNVLNTAQTNAYYELIALGKAAYKKQGSIKQAESNIEKLGSFLKAQMPFANEGVADDIKKLQVLSKTNSLPKGLNELPGQHPIALAFNKKLTQYLTLTKAIELNSDPITTERNNKLLDFADKTFKAVANKGIYSNTDGIAGVDKREAAMAFNEVLPTVGYKYNDPKAVTQRVEETLAETAIGGTAHLMPLVGALFLTKKATSAQLTQAGNVTRQIISNAAGNTKTAKLAADLFVGGIEEVAYMDLADRALEQTTAGPSTDKTFAASLGVGNVLAAKLIKKAVTNKIPFVTPVLEALSNRSKLVGKASEVALGAASGTAVMEIAEGATLVKDKLLSQGHVDQAAEWDNLSSGQHIASTFWSLAMLGGFAPKGFYDALKQDIRRIPAFNAESINAGKLLEIDHKVEKNAQAISAKENEIDAAETQALDKLNKKYENSNDFEAMANEEVAIKKAANILRGDLEIKNAKLNIEAGHAEPTKSDLFVAANKIKYGEKLDGNDIYALSITPAAIVKNQMGFDSVDPIYKNIKHYQNKAQQYGEQLDQFNIKGDSKERKEMLSNMFEASDLYNEINVLKQSSKTDPALTGINEKRIAEIEAKIEKLNTKNDELQEADKVRADRDFDIDINAAIATAKRLGKAEPVMHKTQEEFEAAYEKIYNKKPEEGGNAFFVGDQIHINEARGRDQKLVGTGSHESGHSFFSKWMKDANGELTKEGVDFIDNWKAKLSPKEQSVIDNRINKNYKYEKDKDGNVVEKDKKAYYEEYLTAFIESVRSGEITYKSDSFEKLKAPVEKILVDLGFKKAKFLPGEEGLKEMYTMLKDIALMAKEGKVSEVAVEFAKKQDQNSGEIKSDKELYSKTESENLKKELKELEDQYDEGYGDLPEEEYLPEKKNLESKIALALKRESLMPVQKETTKKEVLTEEDEVKQIIKETKGSIASDKVQKIYEAKGVNGAGEIIELFKPITKRIANKRRNAPGFDEPELISEIENGKGGILDLIRSYNPSKGISLANFVNTYLPVRAISASRRILDNDFSKDVTEEKGLMAEETVSEVAEKPKYANVFEANVFEPEVLANMEKKVLTNVRTLKNRFDAPVSMNRTVTPFVGELSEALGKQLDIDIKTAMGGKKDNQLRNWLLKNKKFMLENLTTTFLMGKDGQGGIPQAIQKRINGKWVNYPEWKTQKIDRESTKTDNAGRTSGHELVRRLPNVAKNVPDSAFLGQFLEPDGNPTRARKEAASKAMATVIGLDMVTKSLVENGPIGDALKINQERLGAEIAEHFAREVMRQAEMGNARYSLTPGEREAVRVVKQELFDWVKDRSEEEFRDIQDFLRYDRRKRPESYSPVIQTYLNYVKDIETAQKQKLGSKTNRIGSIAHENRLKDIIKNSGNNDKVLLDNLSTFLKAELKNYKSNNGNFITTNRQYYTNIIIPALGEKRFNELREKGLIGLSEKVVNGEIRTYIDINGERLNNYLPITEVKTKLSANKDVKPTIEAIDKEAGEAAVYTVDTLDFYKNSKDPDALANGMSHIDLLGTDMQGALRKMYKMGFYTSGLKAGELRLEHNTTINDLKAELKRFLVDKDYSRKDLEDFIGTLKVNLIPVEADTALTNAGLKKSGANRNENLEFIQALEPYYNKGELHNIDAMYGSEAKFENLVKASKAVNAQYSRTNATANESVTKSLTEEYFKEKKGISVLDFDDTLGITKSNVLYTMPDGERGVLNAEEFAKKGGELLNSGATFDFSEFSKVVGAKAGPMVEKALKLAGKFGTKDMYVLTARPADSALPIKEFLNSIGLDIPVENITGLGNSAAQAKADWITQKANDGYNDFYFADDAIQNVKAVQAALNVLDVKSKVQQAKAKYSISGNTLDAEFNKIIEENKGVEDYKKFSDIVARRRGAGKNKFDLYVPPSAADFELLLYNFMGKGTKGEAQKKFFTDTLIKPYINGNDLMDGARQSIKKDYKGLTSSFPDVAKKLEKLTPDGDFTYDQAIRVAMWNEEGVEIPGISQRDSNKLTDLVNNDAELNAFKQGLIVTGRQGRGWIKPGEYWDSTTIISDLHNLTEGEGRKKFLGEFIGNAEQIFGTWENGKLVGPNMNKIEAVYGTNVREALEDSVYRMTSGKNRGVGRDKETTMWSNWVNGSTGTIMFLNTRSAALQLLGAVNFLNLRDNNPIAAAKAFANQPQYWKDFAQIWNSDKMKERRGGLKEDVAAAEIANAAASGKNKVNAVVSYLLKIGYTPTQLADSFAIASGGAPYYRNRIKTYLKEGKTQTEAENLAWEDFSKVSDETQQSGDPKDISKQQASPAGRLLLTFQNTAMQQSRIVKKAVLDLKNGRGDAKTNVAKIAYYIGIQNTMFAVLQQGLFAVAFDDTGDKDKPEKEKKMNEKMLDVVDGVIDTVLRGSGFAGGIVATLKNMGKKYFEEKEKGFKADNAKVMLEGANISPPIGSKLRKLYTGLQQTKFEKDLIKERGWDVMQDGRVHLGPMYGVTGKLAESFANIPMDRMVNKIENASQALNSQNETWQRVMVGMGWSPYSAGIDDTPGDEKIRAEAKEQRKVEGKEKAKETRERTRDSIKSLPFGEQLRLKREAKMKRRKMG